MRGRLECAASWGRCGALAKGRTGSWGSGGLGCSGLQVSSGRGHLLLCEAGRRPGLPVLVSGSWPCGSGGGGGGGAVREKRGPLGWRANSRPQVISGKSKRTSADSTWVASPPAVPCLVSLPRTRKAVDGVHRQEPAILPIKPKAQR